MLSPAQYLRCCFGVRACSIVGWFDLVYLARQQYGNIDHRFFDNEPTEKIMSGVEFFIMLPLGFVVRLRSLCVLADRRPSALPLYVSRVS